MLPILTEKERRRRVSTGWEEIKSSALYSYRPIRMARHPQAKKKKKISPTLRQGEMSNRDYHS